MSSGWRPTTLGDEVELLAGFAFPSSRFSDHPGDIPLVRGDNIGQGLLRWDGVKRWPRSDAEAYERYALREDDVILAMDRPWIEAGLKYASVKTDETPALLVQRVARLRAQARLDQTFLHYVIGSPAFTAHVRAVQTGTAVPHISAAQIKEFSFACPPLREQREIVRILKPLDQKIASNARVGKRVAAVSAAAFALTASRRTAGRETATIGDVAEVIDCLHSRKPSRDSVGGLLLQVWNVGEDGLLDLGDPYFISESDYKEWTRRMEAHGWDSVITNVGRVGAVAQLPPLVNAALGRNMTGLRCRRDFPFPCFLTELLLSRRMRDEVAALTDAGTVMNALNVRNIPRLSFALPSRNDIETFEALARPMWLLRHGLHAESLKLRALRDLVLPRLLSGDVAARRTRAQAEVAS